MISIGETPPQGALNACRSLYNWLNSLVSGRTISMGWHSQHIATGCPGPALERWVRNGMPATGAGGGAPAPVRRLSGTLAFQGNWRPGQGWQASGRRIEARWHAGNQDVWWAALIQVDDRGSWRIRGVPAGATFQQGPRAGGSGQAPTGTLRFEGELIAHAGNWRVRRAQSNFQPGTRATHLSSALLEVNDRSGNWRIRPVAGNAVLAQIPQMRVNLISQRHNPRAPDVRVWQERMRRINIRDDSNQLLNADQIFGPRSEQACRRLQRLREIAVDGIVGPITWRASWQ
jgi:peptidoglycan hydrolase-like protein with peptidoglycan-binding domain